MTTYHLEKFNKDISDSELIYDLKRVARDIGKSKVTMTEYNEKGNYHSTTLTRRFGSWFICLQHAGLEMTRSKINISDQELFDNLKSVYDKLGRQPRYDEMTPSVSKYSAGTYEKRFGGWLKALEQFINYINSVEKVDIP